MAPILAIRVGLDQQQDAEITVFPSQHGVISFGVYFFRDMQDYLDTEMAEFRGFENESQEKYSKKYTPNEARRKIHWIWAYSGTWCARLKA